MNQVKPISIDGEGFDIVKNAVIDLMNQYPGMEGRKVSYMGLTEESGISIEPESGALIYSQSKDIVGNVVQKCQFPFFVVYRSGASSEYQKLNINDFLDTLGAWVCREPVQIDGVSHRLSSYPKMSGNRRITDVVRFNSYALAPNQNGTQDWVIPITVNYIHEFESW